jgi:hypothetical protein
VLKTPGHGTPERWTAEDEHMLTREVETLEVSACCTNIPSPRTIAYSATVNNESGFPYIITNKLLGQSATSVWYKPNVDWNHLTADVTSLPTEPKRVTFLRSLAKVMTGLNAIPQFEGIGIPGSSLHDKIEILTNIRTLPVREYYKWANPDNFPEAEKRGPLALRLSTFNSAAIEIMIGLTRKGPRTISHISSVLASTGSSTSSSRILP